MIKAAQQTSIKATYFNVVPYVLAVFAGLLLAFAYVFAH